MSDYFCNVCESLAIGYRCSHSVFGFDLLGYFSAAGIYSYRYHLVGLVVKAYASRAADLSSIPAFSVDRSALCQYTVTG